MGQRPTVFQQVNNLKCACSTRTESQKKNKNKRVFELRKKQNPDLNLTENLQENDPWRLERLGTIEKLSRLLTFK